MTEPASKVRLCAMAPARSEELCGCQACVERRMVLSPTPIFPGPGMGCWRYACELCGNKRCPHHANHRFACTRSNEPGQVRVVAVAMAPTRVQSLIPIRITFADGSSNVLGYPELLDAAVAHADAVRIEIVPETGSFF